MIRNAFRIFALFLIGFYSLWAARYGANFTEIFVQFPFLNFPVFWGEILFAFCLVLWIVLWLTESSRITFGGIIWVLWMAVIIIKALHGFAEYGPFALRNSALFYYSLFTPLVSGFVLSLMAQFEKVKNRVIWVIGALVGYLILEGLIILPRTMNVAAMVTVVLLLVILARALTPRIMKYPALVFLLASIPYGHFFYFSRTQIIANVFSALFLVIFVFYCLKLSPKFKLMSSLLVLFLIIGLTSYYSDPHELRSMVMFKTIQTGFAYNDEVVQQRAPYFHFDEMDVRLFSGSRNSLADYTRADLQMHNNDLVELKRAFSTEILHTESDVEMSDSTVNSSVLGQEVSRKTLSEKSLSKTTPSSQIGQNRDQESDNYESVVVEYEDYDSVVLDELDYQHIAIGDQKVTEYSSKINNILFRLFIWRDVFDEIWQNQALLGVSFGKPFRSRSIEILGWGAEVWQADGWLSIHNSYFHAFYRFGILAVMACAVLLFFLFRLIWIFAMYGSIDGGLLLGILLNWLMMANFLPILEVPQNAIIFWSLFGVAWAYARNLQRSSSENFLSSPKVAKS